MPYMRVYDVLMDKFMQVHITEVSTNRLRDIIRRNDPIQDEPFVGLDLGHSKFWRLFDEIPVWNLDGTKKPSELLEKAKALMDSVNFDMIGDPITKGGNGGFISVETMRKSDELRRVINREEKKANEGNQSA